ncbi:hypothetical protein [Senegalia massiliensis]|uniref:Uncharacterized protein n=1 Tax=Senegalia massiliensis TaxID=1720316 RepID=A0A845QW83_9CLOT|nr:hypothetical protein [Senegalia massiliensis]NBI05776.1 hypothetical protein [Senegalia massiliensis]
MDNEYNVLSDVIELARDRRRVEERDSNDIIFSSLENTELSEEYYSKNKNLEDHLINLDIEVIRSLITSMYLGRDWYTFEDKSFEDNYIWMKNHLKTTGGWNDKSILINQMLEKSPLDVYLENYIDIKKKYHSNSN